MGRVIRAADLFCGAGGTSTGLALACRDAGLEVELLAVNHWQVAIDTHAANHPWAQHRCESLDNVDPRKAVPTGRLHLLVASPECTHHSRARGGKPCSDQSRASAWHVLRWAEALYIDSILVENVPEFVEWGPLGADGRPMRSKKGDIFRAFVRGLEAIGYRVDWRILNAADHGDATTRRRLFVQARRGRRPIIWPEPTHAPRATRTLFGDREAWRPAREVIDWSIRGESIFQRKRPLARRTMERIADGLRRFGGGAAQPFLVAMEHGGRVLSVDQPLPTITTARGGAIGVVEPFVIGQHGGAVPRAVEDPLPTIATRGAVALVEPFILVNRNNNVPKALDDPIPTICTGGHMALVEPFLVPYYGNSAAVPVTNPVPTVTTRDRFGLVEQLGVDIRFRMLAPHELAAAMGFPRDYAFSGNREDRVKQIGNAVPVNLARALCRGLIESPRWRGEARA